MGDDSTRFAIAQWVLEKNLAWIAAADSKVAVVLAADTAMLAGLAVTLGSGTNYPPIPFFCGVFSGLIIIGAIVCAACSLFPRTTGPASLIYFGSISSISNADYMTACRNATIKHWLNDCTMQVHRNAEIATEKHKWVRRAVAYSFLAAIPWFIALGSLILSAQIQ